MLTWGDAAGGAGETVRTRMLRSMAGPARWLERVDPGAHRRVKGLRLVTAYALAALLGARLDQGAAASSSGLAAGFALWASVSEARTTRAASSRDLLLFCAAAALGAASFTLLAPLWPPGRPGAELVLLSGAFLVGALRRYGPTGTGVGSQIYIGQLLAYSTPGHPPGLPGIAVAGAVAAVAAVVPRLLSGPAEHPPPAPPLAADAGARRSVVRPETAMGAQAAAAGLVIVVANAWFGLAESGWAITASTYIIAGSRSATVERVWRRIVGTAVGVPLGLAFLPLLSAVPPIVWLAAALAMIVYAMALPERYDVACGAYAFALIVTLAAGGEHSVAVLAARSWETLLGGALGLATATWLWPLRAGRDQPG